MLRSYWFQVDFYIHELKICGLIGFILFFDKKVGWCGLKVLALNVEMIKLNLFGWFVNAACGNFSGDFY